MDNSIKPIHEKPIETFRSQILRLPVFIGLVSCTQLIHVSSTQIYHGLWPLGFILSALLERYLLSSENPAKALVSLELEI